jgi:hypothetical protein
MRRTTNPDCSSRLSTLQRAQRPVRGQLARLLALVIADPGRVALSDLGVEEACPTRSESECVHPANAVVATVSSRPNFLIGFIT